LRQAGRVSGTARTSRIAWVFPGFGVGGAQTRFASLANRFGPAGAHVVLSLNGELGCREKLAPHLDVSFPQARHRNGNMAAASLHAARLLRALQPDLVVTSNWGAIEWAIGARLAGLGLVHTEDGFGPEERSRQLTRRILLRRPVLSGAQVVLPSRTLYAIAQGSWRLADSHLHYIPNGIDLTRFAQTAPARPPSGDGPVIGTIAALRPEKNLGRLLRAFARVRAERQARLVIVGDGPERALLEALAAQLGIAADTVFAGHTAEPESALAGFDIFALSSDTEQMPLSLLEAMASSLPAVCTDVGDVRAMLSARNQDFVTPPDDEAFAYGLRHMLAADRADIGQANRAKVAAEYSEDRMVAAYATLLGLQPPP
jgi:glycosyltransferase involved in cell wall biosynthesis